MNVNNVGVNTTFPEESRRRNVPRPAVSQPASKPELEREREGSNCCVWNVISCRSECCAVSVVVGWEAECWLQKVTI